MSIRTHYKAQDLTFGSLFKTMFVAGFALWLILGVLISISALFGLETVKWNAEPVTGIPGLFVGLGISIFMGLILSALGSLMLALVVKWFGAILPIGPLRFVR